MMRSPPVIAFPLELAPRVPLRWHACAAMALLVGCTHVGGNIDGPLVSAPQPVASPEEQVDADTWTGWRGGMAGGVSPAGPLPLKFSPRRHVRWRVAVAGSGNSSPIVSMDQVFISTVVGEDHRQQLRIVALDRRTGSLNWEVDLGRPVGQTHQRNGHASATMATDGERVYAYFGAKGLFCFSITGERLWHRPYPDHDHEWGVASSPVLAGNVVVQLVDSQAESFLAAYDAKTGSVVWRTPRSSNGCWSTPALARWNDRWQIVVNGSGRSDGERGEITAYDLASGQPLWNLAGASDTVCPTAILGDGLIVSTSGSNGPIIAIESTSTAGAQPDVRWRLPSGGAYVPTGVLYRDRLYLIDDDGILRCLDPVDGNEIWRERLGTPISASLVAGAGRIYATGESGEIFVVAAADKFELLARNTLHERCLATPAIAGDSIFVRTEKHLYCFSESTIQAERPSTDDAAAESIRSPSDLPNRSDGES